MNQSINQSVRKGSALGYFSTPTTPPSLTELRRKLIKIQTVETATKLIET